MGPLLEVTQLVRNGPTLNPNFPDLPGCDSVFRHYTVRWPAGFPQRPENMCQGAEAPAGQGVCLLLMLESRGTPGYQHLTDYDPRTSQPQPALPAYTILHPLGADKSHQ